MAKRRVTLYFGSFNPIHNGHRTVAQHIINSKVSDEVWLIVSPHNPLKKSTTLAPQHHRLAMANMAVESWGIDAKVSDIEFHLETPSYSINTLCALTGEYPDIDFCILIGEDNIMGFDRWHKWCDIAHSHNIIIYPRSCEKSESVDSKIEALIRESQCKDDRFCYLTAAPLIDISSTDIREMIIKGTNIDNLTATEVAEYIKTNKLYERETDISK